jgi:hypothetical protein
MVDNNNSKDVTSNSLSNQQENGLGNNNRQAKRYILIFVSVPLAIFLCYCSITALGYRHRLANIIRQQTQDTPDAIPILDAFMKRMEEKDPEAALELWSTCGRGYISLAVLENLQKGDNYALFEGYESIELTKFITIDRISSSLEISQSTIAEVEGTVTYEGFDEFGFFTGALIEVENDVWRICQFHINVPPSKLKKEQQALSF